MKSYYECVVCGKVLTGKDVICLNSKRYYCRKHWEAYLGLSEIADECVSARISEPKGEKK